MNEVSSLLQRMTGHDITVFPTDFSGSQTIEFIYPDTQFLAVYLIMETDPPTPPSLTLIESTSGDCQNLNFGYNGHIAKDQDKSCMLFKDYKPLG